MSVAAAVAAIESLRPDQKQFLEEQKLRAAMPAERWSESLTQVANLASLTLPASRFCRQLGCFLLVVTLAAIVLAIQRPLLGLPLVIVAGGTGAWSKYKREQLHGAGKPQFMARVEKLLLPCVRIFQRDMDAREPLHLEADLRSGLGPLIGQPRRLPGPFKNPRLRKVVEKLYRKPLLSGQARLADGSVVSWRVAYHVRVREITKRGSSGKIKSKVETRARRLVAVRLGLRADTWELVPAAPPPAPHGAPAVDAPGATPGPGLAAGAGVTVTANERRLVLKARRRIDLGKGFDLHKVAPADGLDDLLTTIGSLFAQARRRPAPAAREGRA